MRRALCLSSTASSKRMPSPGTGGSSTMEGGSSLSWTDRSSTMEGGPTSSTDTFAFLFLGALSGSPDRRGEPDLLRLDCPLFDSPEDRLYIWERIPSSMGERTGRGDWRLVPVGEGLSRVAPFGSLVAFACLPLALIVLFGCSRLASAVGFSGTREVPSCRLTG